MTTEPTLEELLAIAEAATISKSLGEKLREVVSDEEITKIHGYANFGSMTPREVVNDGVRKTAVGYHCGHTQFTILREHGLITRPRTGSYDANLTKKGKAYARVLYHAEAAHLQAAEARARTAEEALYWALGEDLEDEFTARGRGEGALWWRKELRRRSGLPVRINANKGSDQ